MVKNGKYFESTFIQIKTKKKSKNLVNKPWFDSWSDRLSPGLGLNSINWLIQGQCIGLTLIISTLSLVHSLEFQK